MGAECPYNNPDRQHNCDDNNFTICSCCHARLSLIESVEAIGRMGRAMLKATHSHTHIDHTVLEYPSGAPRSSHTDGRPPASLRSNATDSTAQFRRFLSAAIRSGLWLRSMTWIGLCRQRAKPGIDEDRAARDVGLKRSFLATSELCGVATCGRVPGCQTGLQAPFAPLGKGPILPVALTLLGPHQNPSGEL